MEKQGSIRDSLILYFLLAYLLTWMFLAPIILGWIPSNNQLLSAFLYILGAFTPTIAALVASYRENGLREVRHLIYKTRIIPHRNWFIVLLIPVLLKIVSFILVFIWVGETPVFNHLKNYSLPVIFIIVVISGLFPGALGEELGWRGYALPRLQAKFSALVSSFILGVIWGLWHIPTFYIEFVAQSSIPVFWFFVEVTAISILFTWIYNNTDGSVLMAILFHASNNSVTPVLYPAVASVGYTNLFSKINALLIFTAALAILIIYGGEQLSNW
jgi:uncharacterized protein